MANGLTLAKFTKPVVKITKQGLRFLSKNSNVVLTVVGVTGVIATVVVTLRGTIQAVKLCEEKQVKDRKEVLKTVWKCYIPTIGVVLLTTTAIICNGRINAKRIAMLASAYSGSKEALKRLEDKMKDEIGPKKAERVIDDAHSQKTQDILSSNPGIDAIETGFGDVLFMIEDVGQLIKSNSNRIELATMHSAQDLIDGNDWNEFGDNVLMMNTVLEHLGARTCELGNRLGWTASQLKQEGLRAPRLRVSSKNMEYKGELVPIGTIWFEPEPVFI